MGAFGDQFVLRKHDRRCFTVLTAYLRAHRGEIADLELQSDRNGRIGRYQKWYTIGQQKLPPDKILHLQREKNIALIDQIENGSDDKSDFKCFGKHLTVGDDVTGDGKAFFKK